MPRDDPGRGSLNRVQTPGTTVEETMRPTVGVAVAALLLLLPHPVASATPATPATPVTLTAASAVAAPVAETAAARERVGTLERVDAAVRYGSAERSVTLHYPGASYVKVHLSLLVLLPGDYVTVSDPSGAEVHRYDAAALPGLGAMVSGGQWAMSITGDTAVVALHSRHELTGGRPMAGFGAAIDRVARGYAADETPAGQPTARPRQESICGVDDSKDAVCYEDTEPTIYRNSKAVVRLLTNGVELCTGFRVGPDNRLMTNHHCVATAQQARSTEVWFNYQCATCQGWAVFRPTKVWADRVLVTDSTLDVTLFTVDDFSAVQRYGYLELDPHPTRAGDALYIPQHPRGLPARVALSSDLDDGGACQVVDAAAHGYGRHTDVTYYCDTDGGSSGAPVLSRDSHRVVALHHLGGCPNSGVRMDLIYPHVAAYL